MRSAAQNAQENDGDAGAERGAYAAIAAGGLAAILASACCLGPLLLVLLGIGGVWIGNLTRLEPYRPGFLLLSVVALFFAGRRFFRRASACQSGAVCAQPKARRTYKVLFIAAVLLMFMALLLPYAIERFL